MLGIRESNEEGKFEAFLNKLSPAQGVVIGFGLLISIGVILLMLPFASRSGQSIGFIDALFTSASASCITGLVVVDTYEQWSLFGQIVIILLVQAGGLGIITMATWLSIIMGRNVTYKERLLMKESLNQNEVKGIIKLTKNVIFVTLTVEFIGAILLSIRFVPQYGFAEGLYFGVFHSVSAFCNAGFDLMGGFNSLSPYVGDILINFIFAGLIFVGGLGFTVWRDIAHSRKFSKLILHSKIVLIITIILLFSGSILFFTLEYNNPKTIGNLVWHDKVTASVFQSVTCRSSGFNTISTDDLTEESKLISMLLMFIGASPGSTGGGIKTVTLGVIIFSVISILKGKENTEIFKRTVPDRIVKKSLLIVSFAISFILLMTILLAFIEDISLANLSFEVVSAFGTVGLSTGITSSLTGISKLLLVLTMFFGRVGLLTIVFAVAKRYDRKKRNYSYPEGKVMVG